MKLFQVAYFFKFSNNEGFDESPKQTKKLFITLLINTPVGNTVDNVEKVVKVIVFITLINKNQVYNTGDDLETLMKVIVIHNFHKNYSKGMKLF